MTWGQRHDRATVGRISRILAIDRSIAILRTCRPYRIQSQALFTGILTLLKRKLSLQACSRHWNGGEHWFMRMHDLRCCCSCPLYGSFNTHLVTRPSPEENPKVPTDLRFSGSPVDRSVARQRTLPISLHPSASLLDRSRLCMVTAFRHPTGMRDIRASPSLPSGFNLWPDSQASARPQTRHFSHRRNSCPSDVLSSTPQKHRP